MTSTGSTESGGESGLQGNASAVPGQRSRWQAVVVPVEHGGWVLTFEAVLLGLLVWPSVAGVAIGIAALLAFLARTPLKLAVGDRRRHRRLERSVLAEWVAVIELAVLAAAIVAASLIAYRGWWMPLACAMPFFALELSFDVRSRGRRLVPELSGAMGMGAVAAAIALAGGMGDRLAFGLWVVLAARGIASVPFARSQVRRLKSKKINQPSTYLAQLAACVVAMAGWMFGAVPWPGVVAIGMLAAWSFLALQLPVRSAKQVGVLQLLAGLVVVGIAAAGVLIVA